MKVAFFSTKSYDRESFNRHQKHHQEIHFFEAPLNEDTVNLTKGFEVVCVFVNDKLHKSVVETLRINGVKLIALRCAGFNNVDLKATHANGVKVVRVPGYSPQAVAEHAVALILTLNRKTHKAYNRVRESNFSLDRMTGFDLFGKTVGVIGTGRIGAAFCQIMLGFGCKILAFDIVENDTLKQQGVRYQQLDTLLKESDILSLHCPLLPDTHHLLNQAAFDKMKSGAMLINTSRGGLIDTRAAIYALKKRTLGYLGIDVYEQEEQLFFQDLSEQIINDDQIMRLMTFPNVLITAHQGFLTHEALEGIATTTLQNIIDFEEKRELKNEVRI